MPLGPITVNDVKGKVGGPVTVDANMHFVGDGLKFKIVSVIHPMGTECVLADPNSNQDCGSSDDDVDSRETVIPTIKSITDDGAGMFEITLAAAAQFDASMVTIRATDENDLWLDQDFAIRRNKAPATKAELTVNLGTAVSKMKLFPITEVFTDFDDIEVAELFNSKPTVGTLTIDNLIGNLIAEQVGGGQTTVDLSATDTGDLKVQNKVHIHVYPGPALKADAPPEVVLDLVSGTAADQRADTILLTNFYTAATKGADGGTTGDGTPDVAAYGTDTAAPKSSNPAVASVAATITDDNVAVTLHSVGSTTIQVVVMQNTGPGTGAPSDTNMRFVQRITIEFTLIVR
jgi:hypothetical protein